MDIMDSSDTPSGGLSNSSSAALPLSVDQRDAFASPTNRTTLGGQQPTSSSFGFSSGSSAMDRMEYARQSAAAIDEDLPNAMPTSTDDIMMPHLEFSSHPSVLGNSGAAYTNATAADNPPSAAQVKDRANQALESAKLKASHAVDSAKDKAADARDKAGDMTESARAKAADLKESAKEKASRLQDSVEDALETAKDKLEAGVAKVKSSLQSAEHTVEDKYEQVKDDLKARREPAHHYTVPEVRSTQGKEETSTHPDAASMRDTDSHPGLSSLPSHGNERFADKSNPYMSNAHHNALIAADEAHARAVADAGVEPKVASAREGSSLLFRMHDKLEDGIEVVKEKVDNFMEAHVRTDDTHHLSAAKGNDIPTLIDSSSTHNTNQVRAKMHPSQERTHAQDE